ncbi:tumor necrosis factor receptor superfamily member 12A-like [Heterodontus francisci]|uniref:tumor necrosis factor receptor superfamily member 12A-like n=1 Tax=Heterodontus francisci TaxID=7792 RepID=UPI00355B671E
MQSPPVGSLLLLLYVLLEGSQVGAQFQGEAARRFPLEAGMGCPRGHVWNFDLEKCLDCQLCEAFPLTPSCSLCSLSVTTPGGAERSEVMTLPNLTFIIVGIVAAMFVLILSIVLGVILRKNRTKPTFSKPIEETGISQGFLLL